MKEFNKKFKLIFLPFLLLSIATVAIYSFLNWLLFIQFHILKVDEDVLNIVVPIIFPGIPVLTVLRPRLKLLRLKSKGKDLLTGYILISWIAIMIPLLVAQTWLVTATGKLTKLDQIGEIIRQPPTKYYKVKHFYINKRLVHAKSVFDISGKYNEDFNITIYASVPVFDHVFPDTNRIAAIRDAADPRVLVVINGNLSTMQQLKKLPADSISRMRFVNATLVMPKYGDAGKYGALAVITKGHDTKEKLPVMKMSPVAWLGIKYSKTISNRLSIAGKEKLFKAFTVSVDTDFRRKHLDKFIYLDRTPNRKDSRYFIEAVQHPGDVETEGEPIILTPVFEPFEARNGHKLAWIFGSLGIGSFVFLVLLLFKPMKTQAEMQRDAGERHSGSGSFKLYLFPREGFYITPIIIDINLAVFAIMVFCGLGFITFNTDDLLNWGANYRPYIINGQYWRLFTSMFLHGGLMHLLLNMYGLLFAGIFLEPVMGRVKYALAYFGTGISASLVSVWWHPATPSVGASGAIFGMYGVFLALLTTNIFHKDFKKSFLVSTSIFVVYNLLFGLTPGIDNAAHIGGLLSGLLLGYTFYPTIKKEQERKKAEEAADLERAINTALISTKHNPDDDTPTENNPYEDNRQLPD